MGFLQNLAEKHQKSLEYNTTKELLPYLLEDEKVLLVFGQKIDEAIAVTDRRLFYIDNDVAKKITVYGIPFNKIQTVGIDKPKGGIFTGWMNTVTVVTSGKTYEMKTPNAEHANNLFKIISEKIL